VANDDNLIPLINIVFLLLIFFMVSSQIDAFRPAAVALPLLEAPDKADVETLSIVVDAAGAIFVDEREVDVTQLGTWLDALDLSHPDTRVALQADKHLPASALSPVLSVLREHQLASITLYVQRPGAESL
jgi:biopolymer transport protein ExbD